MGQGKLRFQQVNRVWCENDFVTRFMAAASITRAQAAMHIALLCNILMDEARDGNIAKLDKAWIADECLWEADEGSFFEYLREAGMADFDDKGRPFRINCVRTLCAARLESYAKNAEYQRKHRETAKTQTNREPENESFTDSEGQTSTPSTSTVYSSQSIEDKPDVRLTSDATPTKTAVAISNELYANGVKIQAKEIQQYLNGGVEPVILLWAGDRSFGTGSPNSYFKATVEDKIVKGITTFRNLLNTEFQNAVERDRFENVWSNAIREFNARNEL